MQRRSVIAVVLCLLIVIGCNKKPPYPAKHNPDTKTAFLIKVDSVPGAKAYLHRQLKSLANPVEAIIWITALPDSFGSHDPLSNRITYYCEPSLAAALAKVRTLYQDSLWARATNRPLFTSWQPDSDETRLFKQLVNDNVIEGSAHVNF